jgi:hypothetical protein
LRCVGLMSMCSRFRLSLCFDPAQIIGGMSRVV